MARLGRLVTYPFRVFLLLSKGVLVIAMLALFALNVATVLLPGVFSAVSGLVGSVAGLTTVKASHDARLADLETRNARLAGQVADLDARNAALARQVEATRVDYRGQRRLAREAVSDTSGRISRRMAVATARNTASMAGEALPFVGVAVIVGATAWEVRDACETMNDLHALDVAFNPENAIDGTAICGTRVPTAGEVWAEALAAPAAVWERMAGVYEGLPELSAGGTYAAVLATGARFMAWVGIGGAEDPAAPVEEPAE